MERYRERKDGRGRLGIEVGCRGPALLNHSMYNKSTAFPIEERDWQSSNSKNLIRPERVVARPRHVVDVHHVGEASEALIPETLEKRDTTPLERVAPGRLQP